MSTIKIANEVVIENAKTVMRDIQRKRHFAEFEATKEIEKDFDNLTMDWVIKREFKEWFKYFGPFALMGFIGYSFSVISRLYIVNHKPKNPTIFDKAWYLDEKTYSLFYDYTTSLDSGLHEDQYDYCSKLKCMAKNNEMGHIVITKEEAEYLEIC